MSKGAESSESGMKLDDTLQFSRTFDGSALLSQEQLSPFNRKEDGSEVVPAQSKGSSGAENQSGAE